MPTLQQLIRKKSDFVEFSDQRLLTSLSGVNAILMKKVLAILNRFFVLEGRLDKSKGKQNQKELLKLTKEIFSVFESKQYVEKVEAYLADFDKAEELNIDLQKKLSNIKIKDLGLNAQKRKAINEVSNFLLTPKYIQANITKPLRQAMYKAIVTGATFSTLENELRRMIAADEPNKGIMSAYVGQVARDAILQYDGTINGKIADDFEMDAFQIIGSKAKNSRPTCIHMVDSTGVYKKLAFKKSQYLRKDIPKIISLSKDNPGWNPATVPSNYFILRNGYNCRHQFLPFRT